MVAGFAGGPGDVQINGSAYTLDSAFGALQVAGSDLLLVRFLEPWPTLAPLPLAHLANLAVNQNTLLSGWGVGKGVQSGTGWLWGDDSTRAWRWGTSPTFPTEYDLTGAYPTIGFATIFRNFVNNGPAFTRGDAGSGVFIKYGAVWKLAGINLFADHTDTSQSEDKNYAAAVRHYSHLLRLDAWKFEYLGTTDAPDSDDYDQDGLANILEYTCNSNPADPGSASRPECEFIPGDPAIVAIRYTQRISATDAKLGVLESHDLTQWSNANVTIETIPGGAGSDLLVEQKRASRVLEPGETMLFLRLEAQPLSAPLPTASPAAIATPAAR